MFKAGRRFARFLLALFGGFSAGLLGCNSLTMTYAAPTSQNVCAAYESGLDRCGGDFDEATCQSELACQLGLYRSEVIVLIQSCADRFKQEACPPVSGYFCDELQDKARLAGLLPTPALTDYASAFTAKRDECARVDASLDATLFEARILLADKVWAEARPCLNRAVPATDREAGQRACSDISSCLVGARWNVAPFCP
jgi:hypothetical protein